MFGMGGVELLVIGVALVLAVVYWRVGSSAAWFRVDEAHQVAPSVSALEVPLTRLLSGLPAARLRMGAAGTWTLVVRRSRGWTLVPAVLLFPMGLLFLLFREEGDLVVTLRPSEDGTTVRFLGVTRMSALRTLRRAVSELPARTGVSAG